MLELLFDNFDMLAESPGGVEKLRKMILQLAVQGKLVSQDPKDGSATALLEKLAVEKIDLVKRGLVRKQKAAETVQDISTPYELPSNWAWTPLDNFGIWRSGCTPSRSNQDYYNGNIPWVKSGEVKQGRISVTSETISKKAISECSLEINPVGSVLVAMYGANIGEVGILDIEATTNQAVCACQTFSLINEFYLILLLEALKPRFIEQGAGAA